MNVQEIVKKQEKYLEVVGKLNRLDIAFNGIVGGLVQTHYKNNPEHTLNQNPTWWDIATVDEIVDSVVKSLKRNKK